MLPNAGAQAAKLAHAGGRSMPPANNAELQPEIQGRTTIRAGGWHVVTLEPCLAPVKLNIHYRKD